MVGVHRVDLAEVSDVAALDVNAGHIIFALIRGSVLRFGAVFLQVMHRRSADPQPGVLSQGDLGRGTVQAQHIAVDGVAGQHEPCQAVFLIEGHFRDRSPVCAVGLSGEPDCHFAAAGLSVRVQQLGAFLCGTDAHIAPGEAGHDLARAPIQRQLRAGLQIRFQLGCVLRQNVICPGVQPSAAGRPDKIAGLGRSDLGGRSQLCLHALCLLHQCGDLIRESGGIARNDPELILRQQVIPGVRIHIAIVLRIQCVHHIIQSTGAVPQEIVQLQRGGVLGFLQQIDLLVQLGQLLAQDRLGCIAVDLRDRCACRNALAVLHQIAQRSAAGHIAFVEQQHSVRVQRIRHRHGQRGLIDILGKEDLPYLIQHIACRQDQKRRQNTGHRGQRPGHPAFLPGSFAHCHHPFAKNSCTVRTAVSVTSGAPASSQTTPSMWRNQVSWRFA